LFVRLGVAILPRVATHQATVSSPARAWSDDLCKVFDTHERDRAALAFAMLTRHWAEYRKALFVPERRSGVGGQPQPPNVPSEFLHLVTSSCWVPTGDCGLARPGEIFLNTPTHRQLLGDTVPYLAPGGTNRQMLDDLGVRSEPDTQAVLARLRSLAADEASDSADLARLYGFLERRMAADIEVIVAAFEGEPLICLPGQPSRYVCSREIFWENVSPVFGNCGGLGMHWPALEGFFVQSLGVRRSPSAEDHGRLLRTLASRSEVEPDNEQTLWDVYEGLGLALTREGVTGAGELPAWWKELISRRVFLTDRGGFRTNDGSLFVNDSEELHEAFRGRQGVWFLKFPGNDYPRFHRLIEAARLPLLSRSVKVEPIVPHDSTQDVETTARVRAVVPLLVRYLYFKEPTTYRSLKATGMLDRLGELSVHTCGKVLAVVTLNGVSLRLAKEVAMSFPNVFIRRESISDTDALGVELARQFPETSGVASFIGTLLPKSDAVSMERAMKAHKIPPLPVENDPADQPGGDGRRQEEERAEAERLIVAAVAQPENGNADQDACDSEEASADAPPFPGEAGEVDQLSADISRASRGQPAKRPSEGLAVQAGTAREWSPACSALEARVSYATTSTEIDNASVARGQVQVGRGGRYTASGTWPEDAVTDSPNAQMIGRWGEQYVLNCLRDELVKKYPGATIEAKEDGWQIILKGQVVVEAFWLNSDKDEGAGHDIEIREGLARWYVEVKSTAGEARCSFEMTEAQWRLAGQDGPAYRIARVFKAGRADARVVYVIDRVKEWLGGRLAVRVLRVVL
jgi:hypothetical protein